MRGSAGRVALGLAVFLFAACSPSVAKFEREAEKLLESEDGPAKLGQRFTDANCEEPANTDIDTTFTCSALGADGVTWAFEATITDDNAFKIQQLAPVEG